MASFLITQATGHQSQWVIQHLLDAGASVHAVVRDPSKIPAILERPGVTIFKGESQNSESVFKAAKGCKAAFLNTFPIPELETQQAQGIVNACKRAGIEIIVASTVMLANDPSKWDNEETEKCGLRDYFGSKAKVEDIVRGAGFKYYTILRPGFIHVDFYLPSAVYNFPRLPTVGVLDHLYNDEVGMLYIDGSDVGKYAAAALQNPDKFNRAEIELVNEYLTIGEIRAILIKVSGRDVRVQKRTMEELKDANIQVFGQLFHLWSNLYELRYKEAAAKKVQEIYGIPFTSLQQALQRDKEALLKCIPAQVEPGRD
jgi:uncharacterized protein YbjT (DUF2867 family)